MIRLVLVIGALLLTGCGVQPTAVTDGGPPAGGIPHGMRLYFVSENGLRGVARPGTELPDLAGVLKLLFVGPNETERTGGLTNLVFIDGRWEVTAVDGHVTLVVPDTHISALAGHPTGQLVCTLGRAETLIHGTRPDAVQVTITGVDGSTGPHRCQQFLTG